MTISGRSFAILNIPSTPSTLTFVLSLQCLYKYCGQYCVSSNSKWVWASVLGNPQALPIRSQHEPIGESTIPFDGLRHPEMQNIHVKTTTPPNDFQDVAKRCQWGLTRITCQLPHFRCQSFSCDSASICSSGGQALQNMMSFSL